MKNFIILLLILFVASCKKEPQTEFMWEKQPGQGSALVSAVINDSVFAIAGEVNSKPLFIICDETGMPEHEYYSELEGAYTSLSYTDSGFFLAGYSDGDILVTHIDNEGLMVWDTVFSSATYASHASIISIDEGIFFITAGNSPDSLVSSSFETLIIGGNGNVLEQNSASPGFRASLTGMVLLPQGFVAASVTKNYGSGKSLSSVMALTLEGAVIWETELFNNSSYAASTNAIISNGQELFVCGSLEMIAGDDILVNSFTATLGLNGESPDKEFLENSNIGTDLILDSAGNLVVLNKNCLLISLVPVPFNNTKEIFRTLDVCDSYDTDIYGNSVSLTSDDKILIAGQKAGDFYYALRSGNN